MELKQYEDFLNTPDAEKMAKAYKTKNRSVLSAIILSICIYFFMS